MNIKPIFLLSLPRAGSTLLQRLLSLNEGISTKSEPWIALPQFFSLKDKSVKAIYGHSTLTQGVNGFISTFPNGEEDYYTSTAKYLENLYSHGADPESIYFLDKTPRYHLIVNELFRTFPDGKFIFLWRNPLSVCASMIETYGQGIWNLYMFSVDLYSGIDSLVNSFKLNTKRCIAVRYEDLVANPDEQMARIIKYLDLEYNVTSIENLKNAKKMWGDRTGQHKYDHVSQVSKDKWKTVLNNPFRMSWSKKYLHWIGEDRMKTMGYAIDELYSEIENQKVCYHNLPSDIIRNIYGKIYCKYSLDLVKNNIPWEKSIYFCKN